MYLITFLPLFLRDQIRSQVAFRHIPYEGISIQDTLYILVLIRVVMLARQNKFIHKFINI